MTWMKLLKNKYETGNVMSKNKKYGFKSSQIKQYG